LFRTARELASMTTERVTWLVRGFLAVGAVTELSGKAKLAGKSTLILFLTRSVLEGDLCLGAVAMRSPVVFLTEQTPTTFRELLGRAGLLNREDLSLLCHADVAGTTWTQIVRLAKEEAVRLGAKLIVVDTLPQFAGLRGDAENNAGDALAVLAPVQQSAARGFAWVVTRHELKGAGEVGESGRGSSAFTGAVDIVLRLSRPDGHQRPTVRKLEGLSRFRETPACLILENISVHCPAAGIEVPAETIDAFQVLGDDEAVTVAEAKSELLALLPACEDGAPSVGELVQMTTRPRAALQRALEGLIQTGQVQRVGKGARGNPYRYFRAVEVSDQTSNPTERFEQSKTGKGSLG
jgi:hypothetical protein